NNKISLNALVIGLAEDFSLDQHINIDDSLKSLILDILKFQKFEGKSGQRISIATPTHSQIKYIKLKGLGKAEEFNSLSASKFGGKIIGSLKCSKIESSSIILDNRLESKEDHTYANIAYGMLLKNYSFDKYKSAEKLKDKVTLSNLELICSFGNDEQEFFKQELKPVAEAIYFSRNLISEPPNVIYPETFVNAAQKEFESLNIKIEVLDEKQMKDLEMNALLGVGQGSSKESKLLIMQYNGGAKDEAPIAFVGKGVTFDTGGISIKPSANMEDMKYDMSGAAIVTGLIKALAARSAKVNIVAIAGLTENMPDGNAQRPADVVKSMSGQTIEVINTDAEGRLVLADALWYCQDRFKPRYMIDLATLTGAMIVALGTHHAGVFSNNSELEQDLINASKIVEEKLWALPLNNDYDKMIDSVIADVRNTSTGKGAGSITAAQFLKRFVNNVPWAHLDIAGVSWADKDTELHPQGATGFGIRLLNEFIRKYER
ncbi:MAG: leucyl aminopeptidase, partial [Pseudomonadota bacterium]